MQDQYCRVVTPEPAVNEETEEVCTLLKQCYDLRWEANHTAALLVHQPHCLQVWALCWQLA